MSEENKFRSFVKGDLFALSGKCEKKVGTEECDVHCAFKVEALRAKLNPNEEHLVAQRGGQYILILDNSGSMQGKKLDDLKAIAKRFIDHTSQVDSVGIIVFSSKATVFMKMKTMTPAEKAMAKTVIDGIPIGGSTNMAEACEEAIQMAAALSGRVRTILFTDGEPDSQQAVLNTFPGAIKDLSAQHSIRVDALYLAIGVGPNGRSFLDNLAKVTHGRLYSQTELVDLLNEFVVVQKLEMASAPVHAILTFKIPDSIESTFKTVTMNNDFVPLVSTDKIREFNLPAIQEKYEKNMTIVLSLPKVDAAVEKFHVMDVSLHVNGEELQALRIEVNRSVGANSEPPVDFEAQSLRHETVTVVRNVPKQTKDQAVQSMDSHRTRIVTSRAGSTDTGKTVTAVIDSVYDRVTDPDQKEGEVELFANNLASGLEMETIPVDYLEEIKANSNVVPFQAKPRVTAFRKVKRVSMALRRFSRSGKFADTLKMHKLFFRDNVEWKSNLQDVQTVNKLSRRDIRGQSIVELKDDDNKGEDREYGYKIHEKEEERYQDE